MKEAITAPDGPKAAGPYSLGVKANGFVFLSGQIPADPVTSELVGGSIEEQTNRVLENLKLILEAGGLTLEDVIKTSVYLRDMNDFAKMNEAYGKFFSHQPPARTTIEVARLPRDVRIEIDAIALDAAKYPFAK